MCCLIGKSYGILLEKASRGFWANVLLGIGSGHLRMEVEQGSEGLKEGVKQGIQPGFA